jgi:hypothetical protein
MTHISSNFLEQSRLAFTSNAIPMLADIHARVQADPGLGAVERRDLMSAFNRVATWTDESLATIPATAPSLRALFKKLAPGGLGVSQKTIANIRSLVLQAVQRHAAGHLQLTKRIPLAPEWDALLGTVPVEYRRQALLRLATFSTVMQVPPNAVCAEILMGLHAALEAEEMVKAPRSILKNTISAWNSCRRKIAGWPQVSLSSPFKKKPVTLPLPPSRRASRTMLTAGGSQSPRSTNWQRTDRTSRYATRRLACACFRSGSSHRRLSSGVSSMSAKSRA